MTKFLRMRRRHHCYAMIIVFQLLMNTFDGFSQTFPFVLKFGSAGTQADQFQSIGQIAVNGFQWIYATDPTAKKVHVFDRSGNPLDEIGAGMFTNLGGIAVDNNNNVYVSDGTVIKVFDINRNFLKQFNGGNTGAVTICNSNGRIYLSNSQNNTIEVRDIINGSLKYTIPGKGTVAVDDFGWVTVNNGAQGLSLYDDSGNFISTTNVGFDIKALASDNAGNLFVTNSNSSSYKVETYDQGQVHFSSIGAASAGSADGQFSGPTYIAVDNIGARIVVADAGNFRIQIFSLPQFTISNFNDLTKNYSDFSFGLSATSTPSGTISYLSLPGTAKVDIFGSTVTIRQAGTVKLRAQVARDATHITTVKDVTLTINKQAGQIFITDATQTYDGTVKKVSTSTFPSNLKVLVEYKSGSTIVTSPIDAGTYAVTATLNEPNYDATQTGTLKILKQDQIITNFPSQQTKSFGNPPFNLTAIAGSGLPVVYTSSNPAVATISGNTVTIVGAGSTTLTASQPGNANVNPADPLQQTLDVLKINQTITFQPIGTKTFGDAAFDLVATSSSGLPVTFFSDDPNVATVSGKTVMIVGAGTCNITASQAGNSNYWYAQDGQTLVVNKANSTLTLSNVTHFFDGSQKQATVTVTPSGLSGVTLTYKSGSTVIAPPSAIGNYTVEATLTNANYTASKVSSPFTINNNPSATINNFSNITATYGDAVFSLNATSNSTGAISYSKISGGTGDVTINNNLVTIIKSGTVTLRATVAADANFSITTKDIVLTIDKAPLVATLDDKTRAYGDANPTFTLQLSGFKNGETAATAITTMPPITTTSLVTTTTAPGQYGIDIMGQIVSDNYKIGSSVPGKLTITKAPLTVKADNKSRLYGDPNPAFTVTYTGFKNSETSSVIGAPSVSTSANATSNVGNYDIVPMGATSANYSFIYQNGVLRVDKAPLSVIAQNKTREYGSSDPALTFTYTGFKNNETSSVIDTKPTLKANTTIGSAVGTYLNAIVLNTQGADDNYDLTNFTAGNMTITKAPLTAKVDDKTREYGEPTPAFTMSLTGFRNGDTEAVIHGYPTMAVFPTPSPTSAARDYQITYAGDIVADNYRIGAGTNGVLSITKAPLTIAAENKTRLYGEANPSLTVTYTGFKNGETEAVIGTPSITTSATASSDAGTYNIIPSGASSNNYSFVYQNGTLQVNKVHLTVHANNATRAYKEENPDFTISYSGFVRGEDENVIDQKPTASTSADINSNVGDYGIVLSGGDDDNYALTPYQDGVLKIVKASQTISLDPISDKNVADQEFNLKGRASSGLAINYSMTGPASLQANDIVRLDGTEGTVTITANQSGNANYNAAPQVVTSFRVTTKISQSITFGEMPGRRFDEGNFQLNAHASSNLPIIYSSSDDSIVEINGTDAMVKTAGVVIITATQEGNNEYNAALPQTRELIIAKGHQLITFSLSADHTLTENTITLSASSSSGLPVAYTSSNEGVATVNGDVVTLIGTGVTTITASQKGDQRYESAAAVTQILRIKKVQTISFSPLTPVTIGDASVQPAAQSSSGLPVTYQSSNTNVAIISDNAIIIVGAGETFITASQAGNDEYAPAAEQTQQLVVNKKLQTITFNTLEERILEDGPFTLSAMTSSGLPVSYTSSNTAVATVNGDTVTIRGEGETVITASNEGNAEYGPAPVVTQRLVVSLITGTAEYNASKTISVYPNPASCYLIVEGKHLHGELVIDMTDAKGVPVSEKLNPRQLSDQSFRVDLSEVSNGVYLMRIQNGSEVVMKRIVKK